MRVIDLGAAFPRTTAPCRVPSLSLPKLDSFPCWIAWQATPETSAAAPTVSDLAQFMNYTVENLYNFVGSFAVGAQQVCTVAPEGCCENT